MVYGPRVGLEAGGEREKEREWGLGRICLVSCAVFIHVLP